MQTKGEEAFFQSGIRALQAGKPSEARAAFQAGIDAGFNSGRLWLGLTLACLNGNDLPAAEAAVDQTLTVEPANIRALIIKGDILWARSQTQAAAAHYGLALRVSAKHDNLPQPLMADLQRIAGRQQQLMKLFQEHLLETLHKAGYSRSSASDRFNASLDMMLGLVQRPEEQRAFPQAPHAYYMPDVPYYTFADRELLPWFDMVEAHTDIIEQELRELLANRAEKFTPYIHSGIDRPQQSETELLDSEDWTSAYLWEDGTATPEVLAACPKTAELMEQLPLTKIGGMAPSVLFSKLNAGASIEPHTGLINTRLICHLPLLVPEDCGLRVGTESRNAERGKAWAFDDSVNHEAWNRSGDDRIILLFDVWRPELHEEERHLVKTLLEAIKSYQEPTVR